MPEALKNCTGTILPECPVMPINDLIVIRVVPKRESILEIVGSDDITENSGIIVGCGGSVENKESLLGMHILYKKFQYAEPFRMIDTNGKTHNYYIINDAAIIGPLVDQSRGIKV